ncbi:Ribonucleoside-diphosphate reductase large subunit [Glycine soja]|nr:Ribonucleoside-diphosphate reductase large subunit [Glycine soja]
MYYHFNERYAMKAPLIVDDIYEIIIKNVARLDSEIIYDRDFDYDYFGFKTLERSYILKVQGKVVERPQHMLMRVVVGIHKDDIDSAVRTYHMMSQRWFTHASPTLFNTVTMESHPTKLVGSRGSKNRYFDFDKLEEVTAMVTTNLNKIIDVNYYPVDTAFVELLFDLQFKLDVQAQQLNKDIFQTIYYHALKTSSELAAKEGPYETFSGSPISKGILQPDMLGVMASSRWDRGALWKMISKTVVDGEFVVVNKHLLHDLTEMGLWSPTIKNNIISEDGSVQKIPEIPDDLKIIYKTVWEIKQKTLVDMAVDRGCYID